MLDLVSDSYTGIELSPVQNLCHTGSIRRLVIQNGDLSYCIYIVVITMAWEIF